MFKHAIVLLAGVALTGIAGAQEASTTAPTQWEAGKQYLLIDPPQPTASGDKIEVTEAFSYACVHCAHFQPYADQIKAKLPSYATFVYMPAIFNPSWEPFARALYTAQSMGVLDKTHQALFDALHQEHQPLRSIDDLAGFYAQHGVDKAKFLANSGSFEIESKLARSREMVPKYGIDGTPSIVVNGKYRITGATAGGYPQMVELTQYLVEKEHASAAKPKKK